MTVMLTLDAADSKCVQLLIEMYPVRGGVGEDAAA